MFKFGLVRGTNGTDGITPTFSINPSIDNLASGQTPTITLTNDPDIANRKVFKFGLVKGQKGDQGDKGEKGDAGDSVSTAVVSALIATALAVAVATIEGEILSLNVRVGLVEGRISAVELEILDLQLKTTGLTYNGTSSNFSQNLSIGLNAVVLSTTGKSYFTYPIQCSSTLNSTGLKIYNNVDTGSVKAQISSNGNANFVNLTSTGTSQIGNINSSVTIEGQTISIGENSLANTINIGSDFSTINLYGNVNGFIKQETTGTRYKPAIPFTTW